MAHLFAPVSFCHGRRPSQPMGDKSSELINQFRGKSGRRRGTFLSRGRFSVSSALDPKIRIYIFMQRSRRARGSSRRRRPNPRIVCNGIFTPFETAVPFTLAVVSHSFVFAIRGGNRLDVSTSTFQSLSFLRRDLILHSLSRY